MHQPYVYWLQNKTTGLKYIGVRFAKNCDPKDFWKTYFTSSKSVRALIKIYGIDDFRYKIIHIFKSAEAAILKEAAYVKLAVTKKDYLNINPTSHGGSLYCAKAGRIGGLKQFHEKIGIHKQTRKENLQILSAARRLQNKMKRNPFTHASKSVQSKRGSIGGPKNKGFIWITTGNKTIKYTTTMQEKMSVDDFIKHNPTYRKGRHNV